MKIHFYSSHVLENAPRDVKKEYRSQGLDGALCGYVRKVTTNINHVTCNDCLKKILNNKK